MDDLALMTLRADVDFTWDARGRMRSTNEPRRTERRPAPRLFLGRTAAGDVLRLRDDVPDALASRLKEVLGRHPPDGGLDLPLDLLRALRATLASVAPVVSGGGGPVYRFPAATAPSAEAVRLTSDDRALLRDGFSWLYDELEDWAPCFAVVRDGAAVSVCFSSRLNARAAEAGVETLAAYRRRGFAVAATASWAAAVAATGRTPFYSTSWENNASRGVARRLGLEQFGADLTLT